MQRRRSFLALLFLPALATAQSITIEAVHPEFKFAGAKPTTLTSAWFVTVELPVWQGVSFVGQVPFAYGKLKDSTVPTKDETIGNPAVGLRFQREHIILEAVMRIPLVESGFAGFIGSLADIDRQESFVPDIVALVGMIKPKVGGGAFTLHPYGGLSFNVKAEQGSNLFTSTVYKLRQNDGEMYLLYGGEAQLAVSKLQLNGAFNGRAWLTSGAGFAKSTIHQITAQARLAFENISPGVLVRIPLDDILLDYTIGLNLHCEL
jgi:hypothetical protein